MDPFFFTFKIYWFNLFLSSKITFCNSFCNPQFFFYIFIIHFVIHRSFYTSQGSIIEAIDYTWNSAKTFTNNFRQGKIFNKYKCSVGRIIDSLYMYIIQVKRSIRSLRKLFYELQNKLHEALWFNEAYHDRNKLTQWVTWLSQYFL